MIPAGYLRLPERYGASLWAALAKGAAHKYVRRVPTGKTTKTGKPRYRYYYHAAHGGGVGAHEHMVEGAAFQHDGGHWHIKKTDGDTLHIEHDESGKSQTVTRAELAKMLEAAHAKDLADYRAKAAARVKEARESGASAKQIAALEEHARRAGVKAPATPGRFKPGKYTSKRGNVKDVAVLSDRVSPDEYRELSDKAREHGGSYVRDAGGFVFMGEDGFKRFMAEQSGQEVPAKDVPPAAKEAPAPAAPVAPKAPRTTKWTPPSEGSKSGGARIDAAEVAKKVRADIKEAIAAGGLPEGLKVSVKIDRYSMGQSVDVKITEAPFQVMNPERLAEDIANPHGHVTIPRHTEQAREVEKRISAILHAYNRRSDPTDKHPGFFGDVNYDSDIERAERDAHKQGVAPKAAQTVRPTRDQAAASVTPSSAAPTNVGEQVSKLRTAAEKLKSDAAESMGRDRQVNTRRRAGMAASAIADAEHKQRMGETIARVAHAIENGEASALRGLTSRAQADVLHNASVQAQYRAQQAAGDHIDWQNRDRESTPGPDSLQHVRLPTHDAEAMGRLARMGITTQPKLRAAVEEWNKFRKDRKSIGGSSADAAEAKRKIDESAFLRQNIPGFFPTPKAVASRVIDAAGIKPGMTVLEPSAGTGRLADAAKDAGGAVTALERSHSLAEHLKSKGHTVAGNDTLAHHEQYDRVVMNPPFENGQDIDHVRHAFDANVKPGGRVVAIMSEGPFFRQDAKSTAFREWLASVGGKSEKLPEGSFKESNTGVASRLVTVDKPSALPAKSNEESAPTGRNTVSLDSITHEHKPRFRTSTGPQYPRMKKDAESRVFTFHGDPQMAAMTASVTFGGQPHPGADSARDRVSKYQAAVAAGYKPKRMQIGGNTALVFEKEGKVLTPAGASALATGVGTREIVSPGPDSAVTGARQQHADAKMITRWAANLPESTLNNPSALMAKFNDSPLSEHFTIKRPMFAPHQVELEPKGGGLRYHASSHEDLFRQLAHIAESDPASVPGGEHWATHRHEAERRATVSRAAGRSLKDVLQGAVQKGRILSPLSAAFEELTR